MAGDTRRDLTAPNVLRRDLLRRDLLAIGLGAAALGAAGFQARPVGPIAPRRTITPPGPRNLAFLNLHTGESLDATYFDNGAYVPDALAAVNHVLRDFRTGDVHVIDPRLLDLLHVLSTRIDSRQEYQVISGYRSPATNALLHARSGQVAKDSLHMRGMAIDIRLADVSLDRLHGAALTMGGGGVGYYPVSDFVHLDVGAVRQWNGT